MYLVEDKRKVTTHRLFQMKQEGKKIAMLTAYDYTTAQIVDAAGMDIILVGDSASNVMAGNMQQNCCDIKSSIMSQGYQNQLSTCQQTNTILQQSQALTNTVQNGFTSIGYQLERNACDIKETSLANTQKIIDTLNNHWTTEQQGIINSLQSQLSEQRILNAVNASKTTTPTTGA